MLWISKVDSRITYWSDTRTWQSATRVFLARGIYLGFEAGAPREKDAKDSLPSHV